MMMMVVHLVEAAVRKIRAGSRGSRWRLVALGNVGAKASNERWPYSSYDSCIMQLQQGGDQTSRCRFLRLG